MSLRHHLVVASPSLAPDLQQTDKKTIPVANAYTPNNSSSNSQSSSANLSKNLQSNTSVGSVPVNFNNPSIIPAQTGKNTESPSSTKIQTAPNSASTASATKISSPTVVASNQTNPKHHPSSKIEEYYDALLDQVHEYLFLSIGILVFFIIIIIVIIIMCRRHKARKEYNDTPQNFAHKPDLSIKQTYYLQNSKMQAIVMPQKVKITDKHTLNGQAYEIEFSGQEQSIVYFHRKQKTTCYYEIEVLKLGGIVQIGYIPAQIYDRIKNSEEGIGSSGVGVTTTGYVQAEGENIYNYSWILAYGDVIGIGLSRQNTQFNQRRAWISKNGILLNSPPTDERDKWIATVQISAEQKQEYNLGKQKQKGSSQADEQQNEQTQASKQQRERKQALLKKQRISLKTFNTFQYYPVIIFNGNKTQKDYTLISVNVGGQIFRMYDSFFRKGLLNDKPLFGGE